MSPNQAIPADKSIGFSSLAAAQPLIILSWPEAVNASGSRRACRIAISRNARLLYPYPYLRPDYRCLPPGGPVSRWYTSLFGALGKLRETFGSCTLEPARSWSDEELERFLRELPEIERKSAYCIMMYAFGRKVFPVDTHGGRVLTRLSPYRRLGLSLDGMDHKRLQKLLVDLIPPNLRYSLHVNLIQHGRTICRSINPLCGQCDLQCDLRNFCAHYRRQELARIESLDMPTAVDLFSGAGGLSEGFTRAGFRILLAIDQDPESMKTYRLNHQQVPDDRMIVGDIRDIKAGRSGNWSEGSASMF